MVSLGNNGAMINTVEKIGAGVRPGGMSPESDMKSGGASYVFTRIRKSPSAGGTAPGLYFKKGSCAVWMRSATIMMLLVGLQITTS